MPDQEFSRREKEIISIGASVAAGCQPCTKHHVGEARAAGVSEREIRVAVDDGLCVRRNATEVIARHADALLGEPPAAGAACCGEKTLLRELTSVAAAFAVNCTVNVASHVAAARRLGATDRQIQTAVGLARTIRRVAAGHAEAAAAVDAAADADADAGADPAAGDVPDDQPGTTDATDAIPVESAGCCA